MARPFYLLLDERFCRLKNIFQPFLRPLNHERTSPEGLGGVFFDTEKVSFKTVPG